MISPRCKVLMTVSVKELRETYLAKNCSRTAPRMNTPVPTKANSSNSTMISKPRANAIGPGALTRPENGIGLDGTQALELFETLLINVETQKLTQCGGAFGFLSIDQGQIIERKMTDQAPGKTALGLRGAGTVGPLKQRMETTGAFKSMLKSVRPTPTAIWIGDGDCAKGRECRVGASPTGRARNWSQPERRKTSVPEYGISCQTAFRARSGRARPGWRYRTRPG